jgi:hypothetical protein
MACDMIQTFVESIEEYSIESTLPGPFTLDGIPASGCDLAQVDYARMTAEMSNETILPSVRCIRLLSNLAL